MFWWGLNCVKDKIRMTLDPRVPPHLCLTFTKGPCHTLIGYEENASRCSHSLISSQSPRPAHQVIWIYCNQSTWVWHSVKVKIKSYCVMRLLHLLVVFFATLKEIVRKWRHNYPKWAKVTPSQCLCCPTNSPKNFNYSNHANEKQLMITFLNWNHENSQFKLTFSFVCLQKSFFKVKTAWNWQTHE